MKRKRVVLGWVIALTVAALAGWLVLRGPRLRVDVVLAAYHVGQNYAPLAVEYPREHALFPPDISAPTFRWKDTRSSAWVVHVGMPDGASISAPCYEPQWQPPAEVWATIKSGSVGKPARFTVLGVDLDAQKEILAAAEVGFSTSEDPVGAPIFYREVILPFSEAVRDPSKIRWRMGNVASPTQPPVVLENLPVCGNCHSFSSDGTLLGMDVDYANDKGSYALARVQPEIVLDNEKIISWSDYRRDDNTPTFGFLSQVSPDGRYIVSTVKDRSVFLPRPNLAFSQLFFPIRGILAFYDRKTGKFHALPGADDPKYVQSNPVWTPDGNHIIFARTEAYYLEGDDGRELLLSEDRCRVFLDGSKLFRYDLYRIPFNEGQGGLAEPLEGASNNGMSNYFPKVSPDGKWIVFCRAKSFMLLQPDSQLYLVPAEGGEARRLSCNTQRMNSWHSWSPNSRWVVFSSKTNTPYTQLFLTHIDDSGESSPPVLLDRFTSADRAANIPEFVNPEAGSIQRIAERFLDDHSFVRVANQAFYDNDLPAAEAACRKALKLNPRNADALCNLGVAMRVRGDRVEAKRLFQQAIDCDPKHARAYGNLGTMAAEEAKYQDAADYYRKSVKLDPAFFQDQRNLGAVLLMNLGRPEEALPHLLEAVRLVPTDAEAQSNLAIALQQRNQTAEAASHFRTALEHNPNYVPALLGLAYIDANASEDGLRNPKEAIAAATHACRLTDYQNAEGLEILAMAHAAAGQFDEAIDYARQACHKFRTLGQSRREEMISRRIEQYAQQKATRRTP